MREEQLIIQERNDLEWVTSSVAGRRVLWRILSFCGVYQAPVGDTNDIMRQLGKKDVGLYILDLIGDCSEERLITMMREAKNRALEEKHHADRDDADDYPTTDIYAFIGDYASGDPGDEFPSFSDETSGHITGL